MFSLVHLVKRPLQLLPFSRFMATQSSASSAEWSRAVLPGAQLPYNVYTKPIAKSLLDNRQYRYIKLGNNLEALLISDSETDKAAAALDVGVGHLTDPVRPPICGCRLALTRRHSLLSG